MVRFGGKEPITGDKIEPNFNSSMVRFGVHLLILQ